MWSPQYPHCPRACSGIGWPCQHRTAPMVPVQSYEPAMSFDGATADWYATATRGDEESCVAFLAVHAGEGPVLELAIGTGRIALPLAARGLQVDGIDIAAPM